MQYHFRDWGILKIIFHISLLLFTPLEFFTSVLALLLFHSFESFSQHCKRVVSRWNLSLSKSPQVSRILLSILADLTNAVVWMVATRPLISKSSSSFTNPLGIVPTAPFTTGITVTFHIFLVLLISLSTYLSFCFILILLSDPPGRQSSLFSRFVDYHYVWSSGRNWVIVCISKSYRSLVVSFTRTDSGLCLYLLFIWLNHYYSYSLRVFHIRVS